MFLGFGFEEISKKSIFLISIILAGCTTTEYWKHHSKPPSEFQNDHAYCLNSAIRAIPNIAVPSQPLDVRVPQPTSYDTSCSAVFGTINCRTTANTRPANIFEQYQISPQAQMNSAVDQTRVAYVESCLVKTGWTKLDAEFVNKAQQIEANRKASFEAAQKKLNNDIKHYTDTVCKSDKYISVTRLAPCSIPEINAAHLSNSEYMNEAQKILFIDVSRANTKMNDDVAEFYKNHASTEFRPRLIDAQNRKRQAEIENDANLMGYKITWGDYNRINIKIHEEYKKDMEAIIPKR